MDFLPPEPPLALERPTSSAPDKVADRPGAEFTILKVREVAADLRIGKNQAYELIRTGRLRAVRIGRAIRVTRAALEEFKAGRARG